MSNRNIIFFAMFLFTSTFVKAAPGIKVQAQMNYKTKAMEIKCFSEKNYPCTIEIVLDELENFDNKYKQGDVIHVLATKGQSTILSLKAKKGVTPRISITSDFIKGNLQATPNLDFDYLMPISHGKTTLVRNLPYTGNITNGDLKPKNWYSLSFQTHAGDTIYASRRGVVTEICDNSASTESKMVHASKENFVEICHNDGTFANYRLFRNNSLFVKEGDYVEAGDPIGIIGGENYASGSHLRFSVYRPTIENKKIDNQTSSNYYWEYIPVKFHTNEAPAQLLKSESSYTVVKPLDVITKEMNKSEKKAYLQNKANTRFYQAYNLQK